jgi:hypothetical protein
MKTFEFSNKKIGMAALAASVLVIGLAVMPLQGAYANRTGIEGCTNGYWKNHVEAWESGITVIVDGNTKVLTPGTLVKDAFDVEFDGAYASYNTMTLIQALNLGGGGLDALLRSGVASLLNSSEVPSPIIDFSLTDDQVYDRVRDGLDPKYVVDLAISHDNDTEEKKNILDGANNGAGGCPLN